MKFDFVSTSWPKSIRKAWRDRRASKTKADIQWADSALNYDAGVALETASSNPVRGWGSGRPGMSARERFAKEGPIELFHTPRFKLDRTAPIFTMGSCFARNIEVILEARGYPLLLAGDGLAPELYESFDAETGTGGGVSGGRKSRAAFNKYNAHSMTHEIRRVLDGTELPFNGLIELDRGRWFDPHASGLALTGYEQALDSRRTIETSVAKIRRASVVFLTLGLTETWLDKETGLAMNRNPGTNWLGKFKDRFQFVDCGYDEILNEMTVLIGKIIDICNKDMKFIVTVSPVPLGMTFRDVDIIVANASSKARLRAVADTLQRTFDCVDYFPSYEYVTNSPASITWREDRLHIQWKLVDAIVTRFLQKYYDAE